MSKIRVGEYEYIQLVALVLMPVLVNNMVTSVCDVVCACVCT